MPYAYTYDVPIDAETYARIQEGLGEERRQTLGFVPPEPVHTVLDVIDAWTERHPD